MAVTRGIVLAAGSGRRFGAGRAKPLREVAGIPLIGWVAQSFAAAGIRELVIVVGPEPAAIAAAARHWAPGLEVTLVANERFASSDNGTSLLAARDAVTAPCALGMADHLVSPALVRAVTTSEAPGCVLGVDRRPERCFDLADATKVQLVGARIGAIGKGLRRYDGLDTGIFRIAPELIGALAALVAERGDCSLSAGVQRLADAGRMFAQDIGDEPWLDVDTPEAALAAEALVAGLGELAPRDGRRRRES